MERFPLYITLMATLVLALSAPAGASWRKVMKEVCKPTTPDALGPFYKPLAPLRSKVGEGYLLTGAVRSAADCTPIIGARVELWLVGPEGRYDDAHRATVVSDQMGHYRFESNFPPPYQGRPSHIHIMVEADGFRTLVTQHYPAVIQQKAVFDLVLVPEQ